MKIKFSWLAILLSLGIIPPNSYSMDCPPTINPPDQMENNNNIHIPAPQKNKESDVLKNQSSSFLDLPAPYNILNNNKKNREIAIKEQNKYLKSLPCTCLNINLFTEFDPSCVFEDLKKFNGKTTVMKFTDYLGEVYNNLTVKDIISRSGNIWFGIPLYFSEDENDQMKTLIKDLNCIYKEFHVKDEFTRKDNLEMKTHLIHFIEDSIIKLVFGKNSSLCKSLSYEKLLSIPMFLCFKTKKKKAKEYRWFIENAWKQYLMKDYLDSGQPSILEAVLKNNLKLKSELLRFITKNHF